MWDRMSPEQLARAKGQSSTTNHLNNLAQDANGFGVTRAQKNAAHTSLVKAVGDRKAKRLIRDAARKVVKDTF